MPEESPQSIAAFVACLGVVGVVSAAPTLGISRTATGLLAVGAALILGAAGVFVSRALARRRARSAESEWSDAVVRIERDEKIEASGHAIGGLSPPSAAGEAGALSVGTEETPPDASDRLGRIARRAQAQPDGQVDRSAQRHGESGDA